MDISKRLYKGTVTNAKATLYTVPASTTTYVKAITVCNKDAVDHTFTIYLAGLEVVFSHTITAKDTITIPFLDQILNATELIEGNADANSMVNFYISGREVS